MVLFHSSNTLVKQSSVNYMVQKNIQHEATVSPHSFFINFLRMLFVHSERLESRPVCFQPRDTRWGSTEESSSGRKQCHSCLRTAQTKSLKNRHYHNAMLRICAAQLSVCSSYRIGLAHIWTLMCEINTLVNSLGSTVRRCSVSLALSSTRIFFSLALIT